MRGIRRTKAEQTGCYERRLASTCTTSRPCSSLTPIPITGGWQIKFAECRARIHSPSRTRGTSYRVETQRDHGFPRGYGEPSEMLNLAKALKRRAIGISLLPEVRTITAWVGSGSYARSYAGPHMLPNEMKGPGSCVLRRSDFATAALENEKSMGPLPLLVFTGQSKDDECENCESGAATPWLPR